MSGRFSPPKDKTEIIKQLMSDNSPFAEYRDLLFFAALVGFHDGRREPLKARGEAIRWDVMTNRHGTDYVTDMIAASENVDDATILVPDRQSERISLLEEYANGGLSILQERLSSAGPVALEAVFVRLVQDALADRNENTELKLADRLLNL